MSEELVIDHEFTGTIKLVRSGSWFRANFKWCHLPCKLYIKTTSQEELERISPALNELLGNQTKWESEAKIFASSQLLSVKNSFWVDLGKGELSEEDFLGNLLIKSLYFSGTGFEFVYHDSNMFYGHDIRISGHVEEGFKSADI